MAIDRLRAVGLAERSNASALPHGVHDRVTEHITGVPCAVPLRFDKSGVVVAAWVGRSGVISHASERRPQFDKITSCNEALCQPPPSYALGKRVDLATLAGAIPEASPAPVVSGRAGLCL